MSEQQLDELLEKALRTAAREAVQLHREKGLTMPVWRDGRTVWVPADEIEMPEESVADAHQAVSRP